VELRQVPDLKIKQGYSNLVPPLTFEDFAKLKSSIQKYGQWHKIIVNSEGYILDGHHRFRACKELGIEPITEVLTFESESHEKLYVVDNVSERRHLNTFQKVELELKKKPILEDIAKQNMLSGVTLDLFKSRVDTNKEIGKRAGVGKDTVRKVEIIIDKASDEQKEKLKRGAKSISEVYKTIEKEEKRRKLINTKPVIELPTGCDLRLGDFRDECRDIPDNSIDLIFTDPPYGEESIPLYGDLAKLAARVLKEGGSLVTFAGQYTLPLVMNELQSSDLKYYWVFCVKHGGAHNVCHPRRVFIEWKPMLWFVKGEKPNIVEYISDYIQSEQPDKALDDWAQSTVEAEYIIQQHTVDNQIVLDPFMGSATTGIATLNLKRKFIGIEILEEKYNIAKSNIGKSRVSEKERTG
jgi:16S rRNA G966 N2-methylase RsmD